MNSERTKGKLRIFAGAGEGIEIEAEAAERHRGQPMYDAIAALTEQFPELRAMLNAPRLALEVFEANLGERGLLSVRIRTNGSDSQRLYESGHYRYIVDIPTRPGAFHTPARVFAKARHRTTGNPVALQSPTKSQ